MLATTEQISPTAGTIVGLGMIVLAWLNFRYVERWYEVFGLGRDNFAARSSRWAGSLFLLLMGLAGLINGLWRLLG